MRRLASGPDSLAVNAAYLAAFAHATIFYEANVLLHLALGLALALVAARYVRAAIQSNAGSFWPPLSLLCISCSAATHMTSARCCGCISASPK